MQMGCQLQWWLQPSSHVRILRLAALTSLPLMRMVDMLLTSSNCQSAKVHQHLASANLGGCGSCWSADWAC
jgi:hypothetical protein